MALRSLATQAATVLRLRGSPVVAKSLWVPLRRTFAADADADGESSSSSWFGWVCGCGLCCIVVEFESAFLRMGLSYTA